MAVKDRVLELLEKNKGTYLSGQAIADHIHVSRAAIWKAVNSLRDAGYPIHAVSNKGYTLENSADILSAQGILKYLSCNDFYRIKTVKQADSTNLQLRSFAAEGCPEGMTLIADAQTDGIGRSGKKFFSPPDTGAYLSILLRPKGWSPQQSVCLTTMAAVAMCEAIQTTLSVTPQIKWVNDIYLNGRKICGILTEGAFSIETGAIDYAVLGLGINIYPPKNGFPEDIAHTAGALTPFPGPDLKNRLISAFLQTFWGFYSSSNPWIHSEAYERYSLVTGKDILVLSGDRQVPAHADYIDNQCRLHVTYDNGEKGCLSCGEIQIKLP